MHRLTTSSLAKCCHQAAAIPQKRSVSYITGTHKHIKRSMIFQQGYFPNISPSSYISKIKPTASPSTTNSSSTSHIPYSYSNTRNNTTSSTAFSSSSIPDLASSQNPRRKPTLGAEAEDSTSITNPVKSDSGEILKVKITQRAANKLNEIKKTDDKPNQILRILVESGGCHGYQYVLGLKDTSTIDHEEDCIFDRDGAKFVIDSTSLQILRDSTIDYTTELIGSQFKVINSPYATSSCGCGSSFDFDPTAIPK